MALKANKFGLLGTEQKLQPSRPTYPSYTGDANQVRSGAHRVQHLAPPEVPYLDVSKYQQILDDKDRWQPIVTIVGICVAAWILVRVLNTA